MRSEVPSAFPAGSSDTVEFLLRPTDNMVTMRIVTQVSVFAYPLQINIGDRGELRKRLERVRGKLGWVVIE